jgi:4-hydroxy-2-oxoheptanedioate aldolase
MVTLLVESQEGIGNLDDILAVPGIDALVLGRFDLAHELGLNGDRYGERLEAVFETFAGKVRAAGLHCIARLGSSEPALARAQFQALLLGGARIFNMGSDREFMARAFRHALLPTSGARV